ADKVYYQSCMVPHWVRGAKEEVKLVPAQKGVRPVSLAALSLGNAVGTGPKGITAPLLVVKDFAELEQRKDEAKGKIVYYQYPFDQTLIHTFEGYRDAVRYRGNGASTAAKYGAVGVLIRSVTPSFDHHPHTGSLRYNDSFPKIPAVAIGTLDAEWLNNEALQKPGALKIFLRTHCQMLPDTLANNVIAELRGTEFPEEIITIGGHLDSWDAGEGAHDDGAGIVQSIQVLEALKSIGYRPKRTIRVVLFANEENGLRGGTKYAEEAKKNNEKHILAIESDAGGFTPRAFTGTMKEEQFARFSSWKPLLKPYGIDDMGKGGGGADIGPLNRTLGTPVVGLQPDSQRYFDVHHAPSDVFEAVNRRELHLGAVAITALVYLADKYGL
ncbi:MAG: M20/M25/M40 family metallo-hydrolase, partial [Dinghuibacter sp.]|nr:M20/M25/M40 family metallo-hydrolase [Dinghuibacter sp.]